MSQIPYRPDIDGLRSIAVIGVIIFHLDPLWLPGGFVGVDVFFVISGFLITSILLREQENQTLSLRSFWIRRVRRLFPAAATVTLTTLVVGIMVLEKSALQSLGKQVIASVLFLANFLMWRDVSDYWATAAESIPLLHMWSLAVEEQFYLFFPLLFVVTRKRKALFIIIALVFCISFAFSLYASVRNPNIAFYWTPSRAWELLLGALFAFCKGTTARFADRHGHFAGLGGLIGVGCVVFAYLHHPKDFGFPAPTALIPTAGTILLLMWGSHSLLGVSATLASRPAVYLGKLSYSLYLWHWPVLVFCRTLQAPVWMFAITFPLSIATYELIEKRTRKNARLSLIAFGFVSLLLTGFFVRNGTIQSAMKFDYKEPTMNLNFDAQKFISTAGIQVNKDLEPKVVVLGNSMAYQHAEVIIDVFSSCSITFLTVGGTPARFLDPEEDGTDRIPPVLWTHQERQEFDSVRKKILNTHPKFVIVSDRWDLSSDVQIERNRRFIDFLAASTERLILISECPSLDVPKELQMQRVAQNLARGESIAMVGENPVVTERRRISDAFLREQALRYPNVTFIDTASLFLKDSNVILAKDGEILFYNRSHLSTAGSMMLKPQLLAIFDEASVSKPSE